MISGNEYERLENIVNQKKRSNVRAKIGGVIIGAVFLFGPGLLAGWRNARADEGRLDAGEIQLSKAGRPFKADELRLTTYLAPLDSDCRKLLKLYLPNGPNVSFTDTEAQDFINTSRVCPSIDLSYVHESRALSAQLEQDNESVRVLMNNVSDLRHDAAYNYELVEGPLLGALIEVGALTGLAGVAIASGLLD